MTLRDNLIDWLIALAITAGLTLFMFTPVALAIVFASFDGCEFVIDSELSMLRDCPHGGSAAVLGAIVPSSLYGITLWAAMRPPQKKISLTC